MTAKRFKDPNFKLACLEALFDNGDLAERREKILAVPFADPYSSEVDPHRFDAFRKVPIDQQALDSIEDFGPDGGSDIYTYVIPAWSGTQTALYIHTLHDLKLLRNLRRLTIFACVQKSAFDLSVLAPLRKLQEVATDYYFIAPECDVDHHVALLSERGVDVKITGKRRR